MQGAGGDCATAGMFRLDGLMMAAETFMVEAYGLADFHLVRSKGGSMVEAPKFP